MNLLPKNSDVALAETLSMIGSLFIETKSKTFSIDLNELDELTQTLNNTFDNSDFFTALEKLKAIETKVKSFLVDDIQVILKDANNRICDVCGGSGLQDPQNPYSNECGNCDNGLF